MTSSKSPLLVAAAILTLATSAYAAPIAPGGAVLAVPVPTTSVSSIIGDNNNLPFIGTDATANVVFTGGEGTVVNSNDSNNPLGGLTFVYAVQNSLTSPDSLDRVTISGFAGFLTDVGYISGSGTAPVIITRSADGNVIGFDFSAFGFTTNDVAPGATSVVLVIRTDAIKDAPSTMSIEDGGNGTVATFAPAVGSGRTPEPASLGILALGGLALANRRRK